MELNIIPKKRIVITGGPGAGKTAILEMIKKINLPKTIIIPEAASIIFNGGFWRLESSTAKAAAQRAIFHVQKEMETLVSDENKWSFILCDRGTLDGLAYWPLDEESFWQMNQTTLKAECDRYHAVIHLKTPRNDQGYNNENPLRIEDAFTSKLIDNKIGMIWKDHPRYYCIESNSNFLVKSTIAIDLIKEIIYE